MVSNFSIDVSGNRPMKQDAKCLFETDTTHMLNTDSLQLWIFLARAFFFLQKRRNLAKMDLQLFLFSADCLLEREKKSLQSSLFLPPSLVCTHTLSWWCCSTLTTHACVCALPCSHRYKHTPKESFIYLLTYIHTFCT